MTVNITAAGDLVKFNLPMAASVTNLAWGVVEFYDGYVKSGELANVLDSIKWPLDFLIKCHVSDNEFYAQVSTCYAQVNTNIMVMCANVYA